MDSVASLPNSLLPTSGTAAMSGRGVLYIPNFVTGDEEEYLIRKIQESPQPKWKKLQKRRLQIWGGGMTAKGTLCEEPLPTFVSQYPDIIGRIRTTGVFDGSPHGAPNHIIMNEYEAGHGIMPHEDGPKYHPVVATLSLGSHCVFHYYRYNGEAGPEGQEASGSGRSIDRKPVLSLLLEGRSLVISFNDMYTSHLHGIEDITQDIVLPPGALQAEDATAKAVQIANWDLLQDAKLKADIVRGEPLQRSTRWSLTCRDIPKVSAKFKMLRNAVASP